jgi:hypothetical protein
MHRSRDLDWLRGTVGLNLDLRERRGLREVEAKNGLADSAGA